MTLQKPQPQTEAGIVSIRPPKAMTSGLLYGLMKTGKLVTRPQYQRLFVWPDPWKPVLIDTILKGWPIHDVYFRVKDGEGVYEILDGQQRLGALKDYFNGKFSLARTSSPPYLTFKDLDRVEQDAILHYPWVVREFVGSDEAAKEN